MDQVTLVYEFRAEASINRRADIGIAEVEFGIRDLRCITLNRGLKLLDRRLLLVVALPRLPPRGQKFFVALEIGLGADQACLILLSCRLRLL